MRRKQRKRSLAERLRPYTLKPLPYAVDPAALDWIEGLRAQAYAEAPSGALVGSQTA